MAGELDIIGLDLQKAFQGAFAKALEGLAGGAAYDIRFSLPFTKVDHARREVTGIATSETRDFQGDSVSYEAAKKAFGQWTAKNVREMHGSAAIGKAVSIIADDKARNITVTSRISRGAEDSWTKVKEGVLQAYSIGGKRLNSTLMPDGTRRIDEMRLDELSLVDNPANPDCSIKIVKSLNGVPTITETVAADTEADYFLLADACDAVALQLRAGCRPLPQEVTKALGLGGSAVVCDMLAPDDFAQRGPQIAADLRACATALRTAPELEQLDKARTAAVLVLTTLPCRRDLARAKAGQARGGKWNAEGRGLSVEALREEVAKALGVLRGMRGSTDAIEKLEVGAMALHTVEQAAGVAKSGTGIYLTRQEIQAKCDELEARLKEMRRPDPEVPARVPRTPAYVQLEGECFKWRERLKNAR